MKIQTFDCNHKDLGKKEATVLRYGNDDATRVKILNRDYWATGKTGTAFKDGKKMIEMATENDSRLWIAADLTRIELD